MIDHNYFEAEALVITRLREALSGLVYPDSVIPIPDFDDPTSERMAGMVRLPAVWVAYVGDVPEPSPDKATYSKALQRWLVVVAVAKSSSLLSAETRDTAGPIVTRIIRSLQGWSPSPRLGHFRRVQSPMPSYEGRVVEFPLAFDLPIVISQK
jgi:phage gp37-like protein